MSGGSVVLRRINASDTKNIVKWRNLGSVRVNLYTQTELTEKQQEEWLQTKVSTGLCAQYIIVVQENGAPIDIGTVFIKNIDRDSNKGEFGIFIGEEAARGKGYGKQAIRQMLAVGFGELGLNRIYLTVMADNLAAIEAYQDTGFQYEGVLREDFLRYDGYVDIVAMGLTAKRWREVQTDAVGASDREPQ